MWLNFLRGSSERPRGHALVFFRSGDNPAEALACYLVVPPVEMDLAKYVPPMFASQAAMLPVGGQPSAFPLPPIPEKVESIDYVERLAAARDDDLIDGGHLRPSDLAAALQTVMEIAQSYAQAYTAPPPEPAPAVSELPDAAEIVYSLLTERQKLNELVKLVGKLRYASEGDDAVMRTEAEAELKMLGRHLPEHFRFGDLLAAVLIPGDAGGALSQLYVERCFKLVEEDYEAVRRLDQEIGLARGE